jgi:hypothetical protein
LPRSAQGQTSPPTQVELEQARHLFTDALKDEQAQRYQVALEKFRHVQRVKDTAAVRYRIAACLDGLGRLVAAREAYQSAIDAGQDDPTQSRLVEAARTRRTELGTRISALVVRLDHRPNLEISVDGQPVAVEKVTSEEGLALDPGAHVVRASAPDATPFEGEVTLPEGGRVALRVVLTPMGSTMTVPPLQADAGAPANAPAATASSTSATGGPSQAARVWGWAALGTGAALIAGGTAALIVRESTVQDIVKACQGGVCPLNQKDDLLAKRDRALLLGPLGAGLIAGGVVAGAIGGYLLFWPRGRDEAAPPTAVRIAPTWMAGPGIVIGGSL